MATMVGTTKKIHQKEAIETPPINMSNNSRTKKQIFPAQKKSPPRPKSKSKKISPIQIKIKAGKIMPYADPSGRIVRRIANITIAKTKYIVAKIILLGARKYNLPLVSVIK